MFSVFWACANGKYDAVLSLYHDQGHIAGQGIASSISMEEAIKVASAYAKIYGQPGT
nr:4-hydroxythreonine-4-phosphate dehydrogenase PdxA [Mahella sp.]